MDTECQLSIFLNSVDIFLNSLDIFTGHFARRHFADGHFDERPFRRMTIIVEWPFCRTTILSNDHFVERTFRRNDYLVLGEFENIVKFVAEPDKKQLKKTDRTLDFYFRNVTSPMFTMHNVCAPKKGQWYCIYIWIASPNLCIFKWLISNRIYL
jgi:hypothetical protein